MLSNLETHVVLLLQDLVDSTGSSQPEIEESEDRKSKPTVWNPKNVWKLASKAVVLKEIHKLWRTERHGTLRSVFYSAPELFQTQRRSDRIIGGLTRQFQASRDDLRLSAAPRGLVRGPISIFRDGVERNCNSSLEPRGHRTPGTTEDIPIVAHRHLDFLLIVEKVLHFVEYVRQIVPSGHRIFTTNGFGIP